MQKLKLSKWVIIEMPGTVGIEKSEVGAVEKAG